MHRSMKTTKATWISLLALPLIVGLAIVANSPPASAKTVVQDEVLLSTCGHFPGRAARRFRIDQQGNPDLRIEISNAPAGPYSVSIGNADGGIIQVDALGNGQVEYDTSPGPGERLVNFPLDVNTDINLAFNGTTPAFSLSNDPACQNAPDFGSTTTITVTTTTNSSTTDIDGSSTTTTTPDVSSTTIVTDSSTTTDPTSSSTTIVTDSSTTTSDPASSSTTIATDSSTTTTFASGSSTSTTLIAPTCQAVENLTTLQNCRGNKRVIGKRRVRVHADCQRDLKIEIDRVQSGGYDVFVTDVDVDGTLLTLLRGTITATRSPGERAEGEIEFDDTPAVNELPLTFDPFGGVYIMRDGEVLLAYPTCP